jgi:hypothetical protein
MLIAFARSFLRSSIQQLGVDRGMRVARTVWIAGVCKGARAKRILFIFGAAFAR